MALSLAALQQLKPVTVPDPREGLMNMAALKSQMLGDQLKGLQVQQAQTELQSNQLASQQLQQMKEIVAKHGGDIEKALPEINQINPTAGVAMLKAYTDIKKMQADMDAPIQVPPGTSLFDRIKGKSIFTAPKPQEPIKLTPGEGIMNPGETAPFYTQPFAPKTEPQPTSAIQEYNLYVQQEKAAGRTPKSFDEYQNIDANRKKPVTNVFLDQIRQQNLQNMTQSAPGQVISASTDKPVTVDTGSATKIADFQTLIQQADVVRGILGKVGATGAIKGWVLNEGIYMPVVQENITPQQAEAVSELQRLINSYVYAVSGKQINEQEFKRIARTAPSLGLTPEANEKILENFTRYAKAGRDNFLKVRGWKIKEDGGVSGTGGGSISLDDALDAAFGKPKGKP